MFLGVYGSKMINHLIIRDSGAVSWGKGKSNWAGKRIPNKKITDSG